MVKGIGDEGQQQPLAWWHPSHSVRLTFTSCMRVLLSPHCFDSSLTRYDWLVGCLWVACHRMVKGIGVEGQQQTLARLNPSHSVR